MNRVCFPFFRVVCNIPQQSPFLAALMALRGGFLGHEGSFDRVDPSAFEFDGDDPGKIGGVDMRNIR